MREPPALPYTAPAVRSVHVQASASTSASAPLPVWGLRRVWGGGEKIVELGARMGCGGYRGWAWEGERLSWGGGGGEGVENKA